MNDMQSAERFEASLTDDERYRLLVESVTDYAICMLDPDGRVTSWNAGAERIKGYREAEILGRHFGCFYTPEDRERGEPERALQTAREDGEFEAEGWRVRKDGTRFWAHVMIGPIRDRQGALVGYAKVTRDLTERKKAEAALRRSEEQFRLLVQGVTDYAIFMLDPEGRVANWNPGAARIKGYTVDEIVGEHFSRFYTPEDRARGEPQRALETARREGRFEREAVRVRKDGTRFWANVIIDAIRDETGELIGFAKITRDITQRVEAERELEQAREQLAQSQKIEAIGQLTGGMAHDFNNLLMAILGSLELVRKRLPEDERVTPLLDNAIQGAERGVSLTKRMLAFARRQELKPQPIDLPALVRGMADLLRRSLGPAIMIETRFPLILPRVHADANQLELALLNLAVNARDAMPQGGAITVAAREETVRPNDPSGLSPGRFVCLSVSDQGEGMDAETLARAAEPFFTTKGVGKGTGLGLSMVHGLARQSGGQLRLTSRKGEGTTAEIWLPALVAEAEQPAAEGAEGRADDQPALRALTVLAVDDDGLVLMNTAAMLEDLGHYVLEAMSGDEALRVLCDHPEVDLVITDQAMPRMTGAELARTVRAERPQLPVILATGYAELPAEAGSGLPRLSKPFTQRALQRAIAEVVGTTAQGG